MANAVPPYGSLSPFPSPDMRLLRNDEFSHILSFLGRKEMARIERVCKSWKTFIETTGQWKKQCQYLFGITANIDPTTFLPKGSSYKNGLQLVLSRILNHDTYRYYLGAEIGPVPPIPEEISLKRFNEPDPCEPTETIGQNYFWVYFPAHFEIICDEDFPFELEKEDDLHDAEAPILIQKEDGKSEEKRVLKVPNTFNNIGKLFKYPKRGNPASFECVWPQVGLQHGNKRIQSGWMCMREQVIGKGLSFPEQQGVATKTGVVITSLLHRMSFNFLEYLRKNVFPDRQTTYARTSTLIHDWGLIWSPSCGESRASVLNLCKFIVPYDTVGAAVALPVQVQPMEH